MQILTPNRVISIQFIMSAAKDWIESFRSTRGEYVFSDENTKIFEEIISEIRFKTDSSHSPWKTCRVISQNKPIKHKHFLYEYLTQKNVVGKFLPVPI